MRRSRLNIIADLLEAVKSGKHKKTQIMQEANLSYTQVEGDKEQKKQGYLSLTLEYGLLENDGNGGFKITKKGCDFLEEYEGLNSLIK